MPWIHKVHTSLISIIKNHQAETRITFLKIQIFLATKSTLSNKIPFYRRFKLKEYLNKSFLNLLSVLPTVSVHFSHSIPTLKRLTAKEILWHEALYLIRIYDQNSSLVELSNLTRIARPSSAVWAVINA